jgi:hypothetical protein
MSVDLGRGTRRFQRFVTLGGAKPSGQPPRPRGILDPQLLRSAIPNAFRKLDPRLLIRNPVMFVVEITAALVTLVALGNVTGLDPSAEGGDLGFHVQIAIWLWFTVLLRRSRCRGTRSHPGGDLAQDPLRVRRPPATRGRLARGRGLVRAPQGRHHRGRGGRDHSG